METGARVFSTNRNNYEVFFRTRGFQWTDVAPDAYFTLVKKAPKQTQYISDNLVADALNSPIPVATATDIPEGYILFLTPHHRAREASLRCLQDLQCRRVAVTDVTAWVTISAIQYAYKIMPQNVEVVYISPDRLYSLQEQRKYDLVCTTIVPGSRHALFMQRTRMGLLGFDKNMDWDRLRVFLPSLQFTPNLDLLQTFGNELFYPSRTASVIRVQSFLLNAVPASTSTRESFAVQLQRPLHDDDEDGYKYKCLGDPYSRSKLECEHPYDLAGRPRQIPAFWDAPCRANTECPFWDPKRGRGGCDASSQMCEMPMGVERKGFRKFEGAPFCRSCNILDNRCSAKCAPKNRIFKGDTLRGALEQNML